MECQAAGSEQISAAPPVYLLQYLQQTAGNQAVSALLGTRPVQRRAADHTPEAMHEGDPFTPALPQRPVVRRGDSSPLDRAIRERMESTFGTAHGDARVHTLTQSPAPAQANGQSGAQIRGSTSMAVQRKPAPSPAAPATQAQPSSAPQPPAGTSSPPATVDGGATPGNGPGAAPAPPASAQTTPNGQAQGSGGGPAAAPATLPQAASGGQGEGSGGGPAVAPTTPSSAAPGGQAQGPAAAPATPTPAQDPAAGPTPQVQLDDRLAALLEQRADPANKERLEKTNAAAESARLSSLQYSFNPTNFGYQLLQSMFPTDSTLEHLRQGTTQNAYASGASVGSLSGMLAGVQTAIEFTRGNLHLGGDVIAGAGTALGALAAVLGGLSLTPLAPLTAPLAAASGEGGEILALIKAGLDVQDSVLSVLQILLSVLRARSTDDPLERARICQLLKKEANDISSNLAGIVIQVGTIGLGKAIGKSLGKASAAEAEALAKEVSSTDLARALQLSRLQDTSRLLESLTAKGLAAGTGALGRIAAAPRYVFTYVIKPTGSLLKLQTELYGPASTELKTKLAGLAVAGATVGSAGGFAQTEAKAAGASPLPAKNGAIPQAKQQSLTFRTVAYWPSILAAFAQTHGWIANAQDRMRDQSQLALADAGDKAKGLDLSGGPITTVGSTARAAGATQQGLAQTGQAGAQQAADTAKQAAEKQKAAAEQGKQAEAKAKETAGHLGQARQQADASKADQSTWEKIKNTAAETIAAPVFGAIAKAQKFINDDILKWALEAAGMKDGDLDLAGISHTALGEQEADKGAAANAADVQGQGSKIDQQVAALKQGTTLAQQNALQGVADTTDWLAALGLWNQLLAGEHDTGSRYIEAAAKALGGQSHTEEQHAGIDDAYLQPLLEGAAQVRQDIDAAPKAIGVRGDEEAPLLAAKLAAAYPGLPGETAASMLRADAHGLADSANTNFAPLRKQTLQLIERAQQCRGTTDYARVDNLKDELDLVAKLAADLKDHFLQALDARCQAIADIYKRVFEEVAATPVPPPPIPGQSALDSGNASPSAPAPTAPDGSQP